MIAEVLNHMSLDVECDDRCMGACAYVIDVIDAPARHSEDWRPDNAVLPPMHGDVCWPVLPGAVWAEPGHDTCPSAVLSHARRIRAPHSTAAQALGWYQQHQYEDQSA